MSWLCRNAATRSRDSPSCLRRQPRHLQHFEPQTHCTILGSPRGRSCRRPGGAVLSGWRSEAQAASGWPAPCTFRAACGTARSAPSSEIRRRTSSASVAEIPAGPHASEQFFRYAGCALVGDRPWGARAGKHGCHQAHGSRRGPRHRPGSDTRCRARRCSGSALHEPGPERPPERRPGEGRLRTPARSSAGRCRAPRLLLSGRGMAQPIEFDSLAQAQLAVTIGGDANQRIRTAAGASAFRKQSVAFADQQIADVQSDRHAMFDVERGFCHSAMHRRPRCRRESARPCGSTRPRSRPVASASGKPASGIVLPGIVGTGRQEWPPAFSICGPATRGPLVGGTGPRSPRSPSRVSGLEPAGHLQRVDWSRSRRRVRSSLVRWIMSHTQSRSTVVSLQSSWSKRNGDSGYRGGFHVWKSPLEHGQATHTDDRFDLAGLDQ